MNDYNVNDGDYANILPVQKPVLLIISACRMLKIIQMLCSSFKIMATDVCGVHAPGFTTPPWQRHPSGTNAVRRWEATAPGAWRRVAREADVESLLRPDSASPNSHSRLWLRAVALQGAEARENETQSPSPLSGVKQ